MGERWSPHHPQLTRTVAKNSRFRIYKAEKLGNLIMANITYEFNIGIDVSKQKLDVSFNDKETAIFANTSQGFKQFLKSIKNKSNTRVAMEATGGYERPFAHFIQDQGMAVHRRLQQEGTTFRVILNEVRSELADQYIQDSSLNLNEISYLLGFSEMSSFSRAFKRWTGDPPSFYR